MLSMVVSGLVRVTLIASLMLTTAVLSFAADGELSKAARAKLVDADQILDKLNGETDRVPVIVEFAMPRVSDAAMDGSDDASDAAHISAVHQQQTDILGRVFSTAGGAAGALASDELDAKRMDFSPMLGITVDQKTLGALAADPAVVRIHNDAADYPSLTESLPLIEMPTAYAAGATGNGWHVAVLDTGARRTHEFLSSRVVSAACYSTTSSSPSTSMCPGGVSSSIDINSALDCDAGTISGCGHGTHVSAIAAGYNTFPSFGEPTSGVARDARLITINVFSRFTSTNELRSFSSDQILGLERVYALRNTYKIAAANISIGGGSHSVHCDTDTRKPIIDLLRNAGIATVIAAGNDSNSTNVSGPGCISSAITVANSTKSDARWGSSNWGPLIDVVAPGTAIQAAYTSGSNAYASLTGTSMASPHVAGAFAALRSARPSATVSQIEAALKSTGRAIVSAGVTKPRIRVANALEAIGTPAVMTSPDNGSLVGSSALFQWSAGTGVSSYWLYVGTTGAGSFNIFNASTGTSRSRTVSGLPTGTIYVRLWSFLYGNWVFQDYVYHRGVMAVMTSPAPGSAISGSTTFQWTSGSGVDEYWLNVGSTAVGSSNIYSASQGTGTTRTVSGLPSSGKIYVRLFSRFGGNQYHWSDYTYDVGSPAVMTSPAPGSTIVSATTFQWTAGSNVSEYWLYVGSTGVGSSNIHSASTGISRSRAVSGLPSSGTIHVRLWSLIASRWQYRDYTYVAASPAIMSSPTPGSTIGSPTTFSWSAGAGVSLYRLDVGTSGAGSLNIYAGTGFTTSLAVGEIPTSGTIYVRLASLIAGSWHYQDYTYTSSGKAVMTSPLQGAFVSSSMTFYWTTGFEVSQYWLYVGTTGAGSTNIYNASQGKGTGRTVTGIPTSGPVYVRLWSLIGSTWQYNDYTYAGTPRAVMYWPSPGSALASSAKFYWTAGTGVSEYYLYVGNNGVGSSNIHAASSGTGQSLTVAGIPTNGMVYVRLWSKIGSTWSYHDYTYGTRAAKATMSQPIPESDIARTATFRWLTGNGAWQYWLYVGTTGPGSFNLVNQNRGTTTSRTVSGLPSTGFVYVRLWSYLSNGWVYEDYRYRAVASNLADATGAVEMAPSD